MCLVNGKRIAQLYYCGCTDFLLLLKQRIIPRLVWLSGLSADLQTIKVTGWIPSQGPCLDCGPGPQ